MEPNPFQAPEAQLDGSGFGESESLAPFFAVGTLKLVVMGLSSFGFYNLYWFYRHFSRQRDRRGDATSPFWRAVFAVFFCHELFQAVWLTAQGEELKARFRPGPATAAFIALSLAAYLPSPGWLIGFGALIPLYLVQSTVNAINEKVAPSAPRNDAFSVANWAVIGFGGLSWLLVMAGLLLTP